MNTDQKLELIEKQGKAIPELKDEIFDVQRNSIANGYILAYLHSDENFVYMIFSKITFNIPNS